MKSPQKSSTVSPPAVALEDSPQRPPEGIPFLTGALPPVEREALRGVLTPEGTLQLGQMNLPLSNIIRDLHEGSRLYAAVRRFYNNDRSVRVFLNPQRLEVPEMGTPLTESVEALRRLLSDGDLEGRTYRWRRALDTQSRARILGEDELEDLRRVLLEGAMVTTAVCALDTKILSEADTLKFRIVDGVRRKFGMRPTLRDRYRDSFPFDEFAPHYLRFELDKWAQRIRLGGDGSPFIEQVCSVEHAASRALVTGILETTPSIRDGALSVKALIRERSDNRVVMEAELFVPQVLDALNVARGAARLLEEHQQAGVNLARMCRVIDRAAGMDVAVHLRTLSKNASSRLADLSDWERRFEVRASSDVKPEDAVELARLALDAERVLSIMESIRQMIADPSVEPQWSVMWRRAIVDPDAKAALRLFSLRDRIVPVDFQGAASLARSVALALGYSSEDVTDTEWSMAKNPVHTLSWISSKAEGDLVAPPSTQSGSA